MINLPGDFNLLDFDETPFALGEVETVADYNLPDPDQVPRKGAKKRIKKPPTPKNEPTNSGKSQRIRRNTARGA